MALKILLVDDDPRANRIHQTMCEDIGYEVDDVLSAEQALELKLSSYSIILTDLNLVEMSGFAFIKHIKENDLVSNRTRIFAVTAQKLNEAEREWLSERLVPVLMKPISVSILKTAFEE
jgi:CheY-like chemotaxis protein